MLKNKIKMALGCLGFLCIIHSCNYLDINPYINDMLNMDSVFSSSDKLKRYLFGAAGHLPNEGNLYVSSFGPFEIAVDESLLPHKNSQYEGNYFALNEVSEFSPYYNMWPGYYKGIRKANNIITRIHECHEMDDFEKREVLGMSYFLKGYLSMQLLQLYGPFVILPERPLPVNEPTDKIAYPRSTYDECVDYICEMMDKAAELLPESWATDFQSRPTKYAAMAVKSRVRLYEASPWYNGNTYYQNWKTADGKYFIAQEYSEEKWAMAAVEAQKIILSHHFSLNIVKRDEVDQPFPICQEVMNADFPDGARDVDPFLSYKEIFSGETRPEQNPEAIYLGGNVTYVSLSMPLNHGGWNCLSVPQKIVDNYYMRNGRDIHEATPDCPYNPQFMTPGAWSTTPTTVYEEFSNGSTAEGGETYKIGGYINGMFLNREARFYANIGFNGRCFPASSSNSAYIPKNELNWYYKDKMEIRNNPDDRNLTGYTCVKYLHPDDVANYGAVKNKPFMAFRYAEILLNYVEAINHLNKSYTIDGLTVDRNKEEIVKYFNMIRFRAGLPGISVQDANDPDYIDQLIKRERMIEFMHEGRRYHDLRRWGDAETEENKTLLGLDLTAKSNEWQKFHTVVPLTHPYAKRIFSKKMYFYPIPRSTMEQNPKLIQNYGW